MTDLKRDTCLERIGERIKTIRKNQRLTLYDLEAKTGLTHQQLSKIERGTSNTTLTTLAAIAQALHVPMSLLVDTEKVMTFPGATAKYVRKELQKILDDLDRETISV